MYRILYVDDEPSLLELTKLFLELTGEFGVDTLTSAQDALDSPQIQSYDAIIADYQMPGMDGISFLKAFRGRFPDIPFILFTGRGREEVVIDAINNGADFYLQKGGDARAQFAELAHKVRQAVSRRQAESVLRKSEAQLRRAEEVGKSGSWEFLLRENTVSTSEGARVLYGLEGTHWTIDEVQKIPLPEFRPLLDRALRDLISGTSPYNVEFKIRRRSDGAVLDIHSLAEYNPGRNTVFGVIHDITERKSGEGVLRESEQRMREIIDNAPFGAHLYELTPEGDLVFTGANRAADSILGVNHQRFIGKTIGEAFPPLCRTDIPDAYRRVAATGEQYNADQVDYSDDGGIRGAFEVHAFQTGPCRMATFFLDITERKRAEETLRESEAKYRELADHLPQMIFEMDPDFQITYANRHALSVFRITEKDFENGIRALSFIEPSQHARVQENVQKLLNGIPVEPQEYTALRKDGSRFQVIFSTAPIYRDKKITGLRGIIDDISALKKMEMKLRECEEKFRSYRENALS